MIRRRVNIGIPEFRQERKGEGRGKSRKKKKTFGVINQKFVWVLFFPVLFSEKENTRLFWGQKSFKKVLLYMLKKCFLGRFRQFIFWQLFFSFFFLILFFKCNFYPTRKGRNFLHTLSPPSKKKRNPLCKCNSLQCNPLVERTVTVKPPIAVLQ